MRNCRIGPGPACTNATDGCVDDNKEWARISIYMESLESEMLVEVSKSSVSCSEYDDRVRNPSLHFSRLSER
ncbi:hypothetical protein PRIPAC_81921 [Pristionchus pacificus]|uniref:Uncharacterized protein n=1 Tax=Pristionchus pacificus TaxID=54126 RepID=A0A2A6CP41_PRIPA|nr:hypothetical protein PRIPAC_81921 [Pristionchus pacificus]|eukprot:PDM79866.1 hypothetical protein PRIPAC_32445 [Pristionchus pacificus]